MDGKIVRRGGSPVDLIRFIDTTEVVSCYQARHFRVLQQVFRS